MGLCHNKEEGIPLYGAGVNSEGLSFVEGVAPFFVVKLVKFGDNVAPCYEIEVNHACGGVLARVAEECV
jgi:hypothetical protein